MEIIFKDFYKNFYLRTGGFLPTAPLNQYLYPGDFFQIIHGQIAVLGNIFSRGIVNREACELQNGVKLNGANWAFSEGVRKPYAGRGAGESPAMGEFQFSKQILAFAHKGSFIFKGNNPESLKIMNWADIQQQLIIKMTQTVYSFRQLYVVTESASTSDWTLAVANSGKAELEIATDEESFGLADIFGHNTGKTIQSRDIEYYHRESKRKPNFFKAKKLVVQQERTDALKSQLLNDSENQEAWAKEFYDFDGEHEAHPVSNYAQANLLDLLKGDQLNANTVLNYFTWSDMNLDDMEMLFLQYV